MLGEEGGKGEKCQAAGGDSFPAGTGVAGQVCNSLAHPSCRFVSNSLNGIPLERL